MSISISIVAVVFSSLITYNYLYHVPYQKHERDYTQLTSSAINKAKALE